MNICKECGAHHKEQGINPFLMLCENCVENDRIERAESRKRKQIKREDEELLYERYGLKRKGEKTFIDEYGTIPEDVKEEFNKLFEEIATETKVLSTNKVTTSQTEEYARLCWLKLQETEEE